MIQLKNRPFAGKAPTTTQQAEFSIGWRFCPHYEQYQKDGILCVKEGQKSLADKTGMCLKSINRAVKTLSEQGLIRKQGNKILVEKQQYEKMKALISEKTDIG